MNLVHIIEVVLAFGFMIFIHEGGHYLACRLFGVDVEEFALGFGPTLFSRKWGATLYTLRSIPLGGFCKPKGGDLSGQSAEEMYAKAPEQGEFLFASWWKRILIFLAGPGMNLVSAFTIIFLIILILGEPFSDEKPILGFVQPGSQAEKAGLRQGDLILKVDGKDTPSFKSFDEDFPAKGKTCVITVQRGDKTIETKFENPPKSANPNLPEPELGISGTTPPIVGEAVMGQPARNAGVQDGDLIVSVNGKKPSDWNEVTYLIRNAKSDPLILEISRNNAVHKLSIQRVFNGDHSVVGIAPKSEEEKYKKVSVSQAFQDTVNFTVNTSGAMLSGIGKLVTGKVSLKDNVAGPITIMRMLYHRSTQKVEDFLSLVAVISLMLCLMNLLPIPVVDGGQIVLCFIEGLKRKPVSVKIQMAYQQVGFFLIVGLMALAVFNDFKNIFLEIHNHIH